MNFPRLTFPLTVDFGDTEYWIGEQGPFKYGAAVTAFFIGEDIGEVSNDGIPLMRELERQLQTFGSHLKPYVREREIDAAVFLCPEEQAVNCSVCLVFHPTDGRIGIMTERYSFSSLRDFLFVELGKAILRGNAPRQCRLCGRWFLHEQGDRAMYCERIAPGEAEQTCREIGARAVFEKKIQDEDTWKLYKRAYKKYYARYMKGNMSEKDFKAWATQAARDRDTAIERLKAESDAALAAQVIERLREELNRK
ncbi:DUF6076 domain-containing protein [uncultured Oscillibacter sp.]|uniref:DUF6076 domain-containing protein n=1 Tax=uncultured Oscillibacter sp. TaxID=876091 RepID=UPI0026395FCE|nr:DUF6076 domain-containing protein [uncultured Oscillibacter sp.]